MRCGEANASAAAWRRNLPMLNAVERYVIARESNIIRVDFSRAPDPPAPCFPGANSLRPRDTECDGDNAPPSAYARAAIFDGATPISNQINERRSAWPAV